MSVTAPVFLRTGDGGLYIAAPRIASVLSGAVAGVYIALAMTRANGVTGWRLALRCASLISVCLLVECGLAALIDAGALGI
jgi:hypothetical protein